MESGQRPQRRDPGEADSTWLKGGEEEGAQRKGWWTGADFLGSFYTKDTSYK